MISTTLDTYTHVLDEHKHDGMALMEDLYADHSAPDENSSYPVIITMMDSGIMTFHVAGIPTINFSSQDMQSGIRYVKECLHEELLTLPYPPIIPAASDIVLAPSQVLVQISA